MPARADYPGELAAASIALLHRELAGRLAAHSDTAPLDARLLLAHICQRPPAWVLAHPEAMLTPLQQQTLTAALARLEAGEPLPYVLGEWEFYGQPFFVSPAALIPRPETELLVEQALAWLGAHPAARKIVDVGTGAGGIAVSLARRFPTLSVVAVDLSWSALQVARRNVERAGLAHRISLVQADLMLPGSSRFDLVCANLPYIPSGKLPGLAVARHEPLLALDGGPDGLALFRRLLEDLPARLAFPALVLLEIEASLGLAASELARRTFPSAAVQVLPDLAGLDRLVRIQLGAE